MQTDLFPNLQPPSEQPIAQGEALALVGPLIPTIWQIAERGLVSAQAADKASAGESAPFEENAFAQALHNGVKAHARLLMRSNPEVEVIDGIRFLLGYHGRLIQLKKIGRSGLPSFSDKEEGVRLVRQLAGRVLLTVGMRVARARDKIQRLELICMKDVDKVWWQCVLPVSEVANTPRAAARRPAQQHEPRRTIRRKSGGSLRKTQTNSTKE